MALTDIKEKTTEQRKREKRLVHLTNSLSRDFVNSLGPKTKLHIDTADYVVKSVLDYLFFNENKEMGELNEINLKHFLLDYAPRKLNFTAEAVKEVPVILPSFFEFLEANGYIKNSGQLVNVVKENSRQLLKSLPTTKTTIKQSKEKVVAKKKSTPGSKPVMTAGRNDPCPCGSGKKYKKCCGKLV